jgi:SpoIID/LytB domain protein
MARYSRVAKRFKLGGPLLCAALLSMTLSGAPLAEAASAGNVLLTGHGWGHGRGMGQWGALGYALDHGWSYQQILDHFYGGTAAGGGGDIAMSVRLMRFDGRDTVMLQEQARLHTSAAPGAFAVLRSHEVSPNVFAVDRADGCGGPFTPVATVTGPVVFTPEAPASDLHADMLQLCEPDGTQRRVRGDVQVVDEGGSPRTVNRLGMEAYLRGVVPQESPASWGALGGGAGMHALRAQAVAARSYAAAESRWPYAKTCDTTSCQMYGGVTVQGPAGVSSVEQPTTDAAVAQTAGEVRRFGNGQVARTEFSSSTGGWSAGGTFPAVPDEGDTRSPHHTWTVAVPFATVEAAYPSIGAFRAIDVTQRNGVGDWGGRVLAAVVRGSAGSVMATGDDLRARLGVRSAWFKLATSARPAVVRGDSWFLRSTLNGGVSDMTVSYGNTGDAHLMCDWDGDGTRSPGVVRNGWFYLRNSNSSGAADISFPYGNAGDTPVCGDWNGDGIDTVGVVRNGQFLLRNSNSAGNADVAFSYGNSNDIPLVCDWNGGGRDTVGVARAGWFYLRTSNTSGAADIAFPFGNAGDTPVCGDWNGDGIDTVGVVRAGTWYLRNVHGAGAADLVFGYGDAGDQPVVWR